MGIDDANAGYPALFFAGLVLAASVPVWIVSLAFGGIALARREPGPVAPLFVVVLSVVLLLMALPSAYRVVRAILGA